MRLIDTGTRELREFYHDIPEYAILSHTWDEEELLFEHFKLSDAKDRPGFEKVDNCCKLAASRGFKYVWIDTCCIDKNSSAELQEAINSMYSWYKNSEVCFAYLKDVPSNTNTIKSPTFENSLWFTRGWTLQELIAPLNVEFYGKNDVGKWGEIGTKLSLQDTIAKVTGVPIHVLRTGDVKSMSVATRMSWASRRETKRVEDRAYSLMGIFDVHMPMVYGEGKRAFERLQEEILKVSNDHSLFAWKPSKQHRRHWTGQGLLADSPADFGRSGQYVCSNNSEDSTAYQITNVGLRILLPLIQISPNQASSETEEDSASEGVTASPAYSKFYGVLNCSSSNKLHRLGILLRLTQRESGEERALVGSRCFAGTLDDLIDIDPAVFPLAETRVVYITRNKDDAISPQESAYVDCHISLCISSTTTVKILDAWPSCEAEVGIKAKGRRSKTVLAAIILRYTLGLREGRFAIVMGLFDGEAWCDVVADDRERDAKTIWKSHKYLNQPDRNMFCLDGKSALLIAIRKRGKQGSKTPTDKAFTLYIEDPPPDT